MSGKDLFFSASVDDPISTCVVRCSLFLAELSFGHQNAGMWGKVRTALYVLLKRIKPTSFGNKNYNEPDPTDVSCKIDTAFWISGSACIPKGTLTVSAPCNYIEPRLSNGVLLIFSKSANLWEEPPASHAGTYE